MTRRTSDGLARRVRARRGRARAGDAVARRAVGQPTSSRPWTRPTRSSGLSRKARTPTTFRRWRRSIPNLFGIAVVTADGKVYTAGDVKTEVSIQSISKVFTMAQVIQEQGLDSIAKRIGVDATGARFNSIIAVEGVRTVVGTGAPEMNPLVNPGAISATSMVTGATVRRGVEEDHRLPQRRCRTPAERAAGRLQVRVRHQPAQPGDRRADAGLRLHQEQLAAGGRSLHAAVLDRRERAGPGDDGRDAGRRRHESRSPANR